MDFEKKFLLDPDEYKTLPVELRDCRPDDLAELFLLDRGPDADALSPRQAERCLESGFIVRAHAGNSTAGYIAVCKTGSDCAELRRVLVSPRFRKQELASALAKYAAKRAETELKARFLAAEVHPNNLPAICAIHKLRDMRIRSLRLRSRRGLRYLMLRDRRDDELFRDFLRLPLSDVYGISRLLARGYVSTFCYTGSKEPMLWLGK